MPVITLNRPTIIYLYGLPGSGKSFLARSLVEVISAAHVSADRLRGELFARPRYDTQEEAIINHLMSYIAGEFLRTGVSVVFDTNAARFSQRRQIRDLARKHKADHLLVWLQIDHETAYGRTQQRDRRTTDEKFAQVMTKNIFDNKVVGMQNPKEESYVVVSGKHSFTSQKSALLNKLYQMGLVGSGTVQTNITKPGLVNLVPNPSAGRVDMSRRGITIE